MFTLVLSKTTGFASVPPSRDTSAANAIPQSNADNITASAKIFFNELPSYEKIMCLILTNTE